MNTLRPFAVYFALALSLLAMVPAFPTGELLYTQDQSLSNCRNQSNLSLLTMLSLSVAILKTGAFEVG